MNFNKAHKFQSKGYRQTHMETHLKEFLAAQIKSMRTERGLSQCAFSKLLGTSQTVVSRLENPEYGKFTLATLIGIANKLNIALSVTFMSYPAFLKVSDRRAKSKRRVGV